MPREFKASKAVRARVPLLVGLYGPSGCGKTLSALRLAKGMGGKIYMLDTEAKRGLHYAKDFDYQHVPFEPPYSPSDYADALTYCKKQGADVVIIDSASHLHEGPGGMLEMHADELARMGGKDSMNFTAWIKPKRQLVQFVQHLLRFDMNFIFCFRAKEKLKIRPREQPVNMGWMPIMPDELPYEMTVNALLLPGAGGVPTWKSDMPGEHVMVKLPGWARAMLTSGKPFDEDMGRQLAQWAAGDEPPAKAPTFSDGYKPELKGKPLDSADLHEVGNYITYLEAKLKHANENDQRRAAFGIQQALESATSYYESVVAAEMDRAKQRDSQPPAAAEQGTP
jgi:hypothetical protein